MESTTKEILALWQKGAESWNEWRIENKSKLAQLSHNNKIWPELGCISNKEAAALIGVASINRESGIYQSHRKIRGGHHHICTVMFMTMLSAIQCNPVFKTTYQRLANAGKPKKTAIITCV